MIDEKIGEMRTTFGEIGDQRLTIMAALTFADGLAEARDEAAAERKRSAAAEERAEAIASSLESSGLPAGDDRRAARGRRRRDCRLGQRRALSPAATLEPLFTRLAAALAPSLAAHEAHDCAEGGLERGHHDARVHADAVQRSARRVLDFHIAGGGGVGPAADRVLMIVDERELDPERPLQGVDERIDRAVALALDGERRAVSLAQRRDEFAIVGLVGTVCCLMSVIGASSRR